jgi:uncharacterized protein (DUF1501 family)
MGGNVSGGLYGNYPSLKNLDKNGNMQFTTDFKSIYAEVIDKVFNITDSNLVKENRETLGFLKKSF